MNTFNTNATITFSEGNSTDDTMNMFTQHVINFKNVTGLTYNTPTQPGYISLEDVSNDVLAMRLAQIKKFANDCFVSFDNVSMYVTRIDTQDMKGYGKRTKQTSN